MDSKEIRIKYLKCIEERKKIENKFVQHISENME